LLKNNHQVRRRVDRIQVSVNAFS